MQRHCVNLCTLRLSSEQKKPKFAGKRAKCVHRPYVNKGKTSLKREGTEKQRHRGRTNNNDECRDTALICVH